MRWVDRGPEPDGVAGYARQFAQGWVDYFRHQRGGRPTDSYWREFRAALGLRSAGLCWYCERLCEPASEVGGRSATVDHFRPLSCFPELAYEWSNWIFSCYRCNSENKMDKWPALGYVDPGAGDERERPERYFDYDPLTGEIVPHASLAGNDRRKAEGTIADLGLNKIDVLFYRLDWTRRFVADLRALPTDARTEFAAYALGQADEFVGSARMLVAQMRASGEI